MYSLLYEHDRLNAATHDTLHELFGSRTSRPSSTWPDGAGRPAGRRRGRRRLHAPPGAAGDPDHVHPRAENACFLPESTERTLEALRERNPGVPYRRHLVPGYGHIDCIFGADAARDVYPLVVGHLEAVGA